MANTWKALAAILLLGMATLPLNVSAEQVGDIQASAATVAFSPSSPQAGDTVTIYLTMYNSGQSYATDVEYTFYREALGSSNLIEQGRVDIEAESTAEVSTQWINVIEGEHEVVIEIEHPRGSGVTTDFYVPFTVTGLPNLKVTTVEISPTSGVFAGDQVTLSSLVRNTGSEPAGASVLHIDLPGPNDQELATPSIGAGNSTWVNTTFMAPESGLHTVYVTPDYESAVDESSEVNKQESIEFTVDTRMDVYHQGTMTVEIEEGALEGPWVVSGRLARTNGSGTTEVPMWLEIPDGGGGTVTSVPFTVILAGEGYAEKEWTHTLTASDLSSLPVGQHQVTAQIDPFNNAAFIQESTANDRLSASLSIYPIPDVFVDPIAIASSPSVNSGEKVTWRVSMSNNGDIEVSGKLHYTWEGAEDTSGPIYLDPGQSRTWEVELPTSLGAHDATFVAGWVPLAGSWDSNPLNSEANGVVVVEADLRLEWWASSFSITNDQAEPASTPLEAGETYTLSIELKSTETGSLWFDCMDGNNEMLANLSASVENRGDRVALSCDFVAYAPITTVRLVPSDSTITSTFTRTFTTRMTADAMDDLNDNAELGTLTLIGLGALVLVAVFVAAILMTRDREEEVERDIFDYCPACDGELEGDEDRCPHCAFNLKKARKQFHDCEECGESIPDLLDNCVYCGAEQDVSSYFEQRQRREPEVKETVSLPEPEEDENEIVTGTENFAQAVKDFGYDEENLEDEWDQNIVSAEAEVEAAYDRRNAEEIERENMSEEELEAYDNTVTTTLKGMDELGNDGVDLDELLKAKGDMISLKDEGDDGTELSASDAEIRGRLYELTGEDGIMPGDKVHVGMQLTDSSFAGNEVADTTADFNWDMNDEAEKPLTADNPESSKAKPARRRAPRRKAPETPAMSECGACGADLAMDAKECGTCGAKFE
ncbi:MAG: hypothetical protein DWC04_01230 [Candidatus Poseidoniales archaeon]|nr:MAG: hypothetical protein DWC04_01230 [Candidatus Poseidoniales archaeon]